jgi:AcrR family transcriptional regulator
LYYTHFRPDSLEIGDGHEQGPADQGDDRSPRGQRVQPAGLLRRAPGRHHARDWAGKGGIYNHFAGKDDLALRAFDYSVGLVRQRFADALAGKRHAVERLLAIVGVFHDIVDDPPVPGGCPVLNTAVESDDTHPALRARARATMDDWYGLVHRVVAKGVERGELRPESDPDMVATLLISTLEGAIMMSKLYNDSAHMHRAVAHLSWYVENVLRKA